MYDYFKPLRRRIGVFTLLLAYLFAGGWSQHLVIPAAFGIAIRVSDGAFERFMSKDSILVWDSIRSSSPLYVPNNGGIGVWNDPARTSITVLETDDDTQEWQWHFRWGGLKTGEFRSRRIPSLMMSTRRIPYWPIVTSLTLISVWLLFSKPRPKLPISTTSH